MKNLSGVLLLCFLVYGCVSEDPAGAGSDGAFLNLEEECILEDEVRCVDFNVTPTFVTLVIENLMDFDMQIEEIKIYEAGTCGTERFDDERFPGILKAGSTGIIETVCNTIPEEVLESPIILRYRNVDDYMLHTQHGNITAIIKN